MSLAPTGYPSQLALLDEVGGEAGDVRADAVAHEVEGVGRRAPGVVRQVVHHLSDTLRTEPGTPLHLAETRQLHQRRVVDYHDVVVAFLEIGCKKTSYYGFDWMKIKCFVNRKTKG